MSDNETTAPQDNRTSVEAAVSAAVLSPMQATCPFANHSGQALPLQHRSGGFTLPKQRECASALRRAVVPRTSDEGGFTLAELLITVGVLVLLVFLATQLLTTTATVTTLAHKKMDVDSQSRQLLDRMAIDFAQMLKRSDVDYYLKSSATPPPFGVRNLQFTGNDKIAFYSTVPGYYPSSGSQSPLSLVAYRINQDSTAGNPKYLKLERMGKGLLWSGSLAIPPPIVYMPIPIASALPTPELPPTPAPCGPTPTPTATASPTPAWSEVASAGNWSDSEVIGPQVFRFEYYYLLKGQTDLNGTNYSPIMTDTPWDTRFCSCPPNPTQTPVPTPTPTCQPNATPTPPSVCCHVAPEGMQDVAAVVVVIAVIDPKSRALVTDCQLAQLNGAPLPAGCTAPSPYPVLIDWGKTGAGYPTAAEWQATSGLLPAQWRAAIEANTVGLPRPAISGIRVYERVLYLSPPTLLTP